MEIAVIAAVAENDVIGCDDGIPWSYPRDMEHFKNTTMGSPVILGRKTHEGIVEKLGTPLPDRRSIVLTTSPGSVTTPTDAGGVGGLADTTEVHTAQSVDEALAIARTDYSDTVYIAGGASVYAQFLPVASKLVITEIHGEYEGDTYFPNVDWDAWSETSRESFDELSFVEYTHSANSS